MAAAIYNHLTDTSDADSAGTCVGSDDEPEGTIISTRFRTPDFFELMEEEGMFLRDNRTKKITSSMVKEAELVVSMAEEPFVPSFLAENEKVICWDVNNPPFATREVSEETYRNIRALIEHLIASRKEKD